MSAAPGTRVVDVFESETCSRCLGSGSYSWCQQWGTVCFGCAGAGKKLTKRGRAAMAHLTDLRSVPAKALVPGTKVYDLDVTMTGATRKVWRTLVSSEVAADGRLTLVYAKNFEAHGVDPERPYRVAQTPERLKETLEAALAYQVTLTKEGKVRKVRKSSSTRSAEVQS